MGFIACGFLLLMINEEESFTHGRLSYDGEVYIYEGVLP